MGDDKGDTEKRLPRVLGQRDGGEILGGLGGDWAARSLRFRWRMYQLSAKKMERATEETEIAMPTLAPSESWVGGD